MRHCRGESNHFIMRPAAFLGSIIYIFIIILYYYMDFFYSFVVLYVLLFVLFCIIIHIICIICSSLCIVCSILCIFCIIRIISIIVVCSSCPNYWSSNNRERIDCQSEYEHTRVISFT